MREMALYPQAIELYTGLLESTGADERAALFESIGDTWLEAENVAEATGAFEKSLFCRPSDAVGQKLSDIRLRTATAAAPSAPSPTPKPRKERAPAPVREIRPGDENAESGDWYEKWQAFLTPDRTRHLIIAAIIVIAISWTIILQPWQWFAEKPRPHRPPIHMRTSPGGGK